MPRKHSSSSKPSSSKKPSSSSKPSSSTHHPSSSKKPSSSTGRGRSTHDDHIFNDISKSTRNLPPPYGGQQTEEFREKFDRIRNKPQNRVSGTQGQDDLNSQQYGTASTAFRNTMNQASGDPSSQPHRTHRISQSVENLRRASIDPVALRTAGRDPNTDSDVKEWNATARDLRRSLTNRRHGSPHQPTR